MVYVVRQYILLADETTRGVNAKLEIQKETLESKDFKISRNKTKYIDDKFSVSRSSHSEGLTIQN